MKVDIFIYAKDDLSILKKVFVSIEFDFSLDCLSLGSDTFVVQEDVELTKSISVGDFIFVNLSGVYKDFRKEGFVGSKHYDYIGDIESIDGRTIISNNLNKKLDIQIPLTDSGIQTAATYLTNKINLLSLIDGYYADFSVVDLTNGSPAGWKITYDAEEQFINLWDLCVALFTKAQIVLVTNFYTVENIGNKNTIIPTILLNTYLNEDPRKVIVSKNDFSDFSVHSSERDRGTPNAYILYDIDTNLPSRFFYKTKTNQIVTTFNKDTIYYPIIPICEMDNAQDEIDANEKLSNNIYNHEIKYNLEFSDYNYNLYKLGRKYIIFYDNKIYESILSRISFSSNNIMSLTFGNFRTELNWVLDGSDKI